MDNIKILLTGAGAPGASGIIDCLKDNNECKVSIIGVDKNEKINTINLYEKFYQVPAADEDHFISRIKEICIKENIDVILPLVTKELFKFAKAKSDFKEINVEICVIDYDSLIIANDKVKLFEFLKEKNIRVPEFYRIENLNDLQEKSKRLGYPQNKICLKQGYGDGSRGIRIISNDELKLYNFFNEKPNNMVCSMNNIVDILFQLNEFPSMMLMEYLPGNEWSVDLLANNGIVSNIMCRKTTLVQHSITLECYTVHNKELEDFCKDIARALNITGNIGFDLKEDRNGEIQIMEINPRLTATVAINKTSGINFPWLGIKQCLGYNVEPVKDVRHVKMIRRYKEEYSFID